MTKQNEKDNKEELSWGKIISAVGGYLIYALVFYIGHCYNTPTKYNPPKK